MSEGRNSSIFKKKSATEVNRTRPVYIMKSNLSKISERSSLFMMTVMWHVWERRGDY
jgi:hypothetical protein